MTNNIFETHIDPLATLVVATYYKNPTHVQICAIEEMSELTKEISKHIRHGEWSDGHERMSEEIGHVILMVFSLMIQQGISIDEVLNSMFDAVDRMSKANFNAQSSLDNINLFDVGDMEGSYDAN